MNKCYCKDPGKRPQQWSNPTSIPHPSLCPLQTRGRFTLLPHMSFTLQTFVPSSNDYQWSTLGLWLRILAQISAFLFLCRWKISSESHLKGKATKIQLKEIESKPGDERQVLPGFLPSACSLPLRLSQPAWQYARRIQKSYPSEEL